MIEAPKITYSFNADKGITFDRNVSRVAIDAFICNLSDAIYSGNIPHYRPIAYTLNEWNEIVTWSSKTSATMLQDNIMKTLNNVSKKFAMARKPDMNYDQWDYLEYGTPHNQDDAPAHRFGMWEHFIGEEGARWRRDILLGNREDFHVILWDRCRDDDIWNYRMASAHDYIDLWNEGDVELDRVYHRHTGEKITYAKNLYGDRTFIHAWDWTQNRSEWEMTTTPLMPKILWLFKKGTGIVSRSENSKFIVPEFRSRWVFVDTDYRLDNLFVLGDYDEKTRTLPIKMNCPYKDDKQWKALIDNLGGSNVTSILPNN